MESIKDWLSNIINNFRAISIHDFLDILVVAFVVYAILMFIRKTRAGQLAKGVVLLLCIYVISHVLRMRTVSWILDNVLQIGILAMVIVFQPELRHALEKIGQTQEWVSSLIHFQRTDPESVAKWKSVAVAICDTAEQLSDTRTGALIVMERGTSLSEIIRTGTPLNADVNCDLLKTIFYEGTPLHDGAVVISDGRLRAAGCLLPLSNNLDVGRDMGTRHRAALGMSENSDAIIVVVSEETGIISLAKNGVMMRRLDRQTLFKQLEQEVVPKDVTKNGIGIRGRRVKHEKSN